MGLIVEQWFKLWTGALSGASNVLQQHQWELTRLCMRSVPNNPGNNASYQPLKPQSSLF